MVREFLVRYQSCVNQCSLHNCGCSIHFIWLSFEPLVCKFYTSLSCMPIKIQWISRLAEIRWAQMTVLFVNVNWTPADIFRIWPHFRCYFSDISWIFPVLVLVCRSTNSRYSWPSPQHIVVFLCKPCTKMISWIKPKCIYYAFWCYWAHLFTCHSFSMSSSVTNVQHLTCFCFSCPVC